MFSRIFSYINFLIQSKNHHGVHSPFVFNLLTQCIYDKKEVSGFQTVKNYRENLLKNQQCIEVTDFGAGSKIFNSNKRKIAAIAKHAGISQKRAKLLMKITSYFNFDQVLEVGTSLGIATCAISKGNAESSIITLEGCQETATIAKQMFEKYQLSNISVVIGNFKQTYFQEISKRTYDMIFFDGNHTKEATLAYFNACLPSIHNNSTLIFDDIHWSKEMEEAWEEIKSHEKVTVTIDTYQWGMVFFRKEQQKEHFIIRV